MNLSPQQTAELHDLLWGLRAGTATADELAKLERWVCEDTAARAFYVRYMHLCADLHWNATGNTGDDACGTMNNATPDEGVPAFVLPIPGTSVEHSAFSIYHSGFGSVFFSYMVATTLMGAALAVAWIWKLPDYSQMALQSPSSADHRARELGPATEFVGQVTGMVDCRWSDPNTATIERAHVPVGRKYALASGLVEITYNTGAKVILQGPCTYEVESAASGYLSVGKLTARVEKKEERRTKNEELSASRSSFLIPHSYFAVRTPTATVADLGTEFGVEVSEKGDTTSQVFRGSVQLQLVASGEKPSGKTWVLRENESACVERIPGDSHGEPSVTVAPVGDTSTGFVRKMRGRTASPRLMHLWTFDSDGEDSIGGNDYRLVFSGSAASDTSDSQIGTGALSGVADAGSFASVKTYFPPDSQFTISTWIKTNSGGFNHAIFAWGQREDNGTPRQLLLSRQFRLGEDPYAGELIYGQSGVGETWHRVRTGPYEINNGVWRHVAVTRARHKATLYIDGATEDNWTTYVLGDEPRTDEVTIGGMTFQSYPFCGRIDDLGYWSASLTVAQVRAIYNLGKHPAARYSQKDVAALFDLYARGTGQLVCGGRRWTVRSALPEGIPGSLVDHGNGELTLYLDTDAGLISSAIGSTQNPNQ